MRKLNEYYSNHGIDWNRVMYDGCMIMDSDGNKWLSVRGKNGNLHIDYKILQSYKNGGDYSYVVDIHQGVLRLTKK